MFAPYGYLSSQSEFEPKRKALARGSSLKSDNALTHAAKLLFEGNDFI
jgi:hypothetical protein